MTKIIRLLFLLCLFLIIFASCGDDSDDPTTDWAGSCTCESNTYNCDDFPIWADAQACFKNCSYDVHDLDHDDDGIPCEDLR